MEQLRKTISLWWWCWLIFNYIKTTNVTGKVGFPFHSIKTQRSTVESLHPGEQVSKFPTWSCWSFLTWPSQQTSVSGLYTAAAALHWPKQREVGMREGWEWDQGNCQLMWNKKNKCGCIRWMWKTCQNSCHISVYTTCYLVSQHNALCDTHTRDRLSSNVHRAMGGNLYFRFPGQQRVIS